LSDAAGSAQEPRPAGLLRRTAAMVYDGLLLFAMMMIATALFLPFTAGEAVRWGTFPLLTVLHRLALLGIVIGFYGICWTRQGQTLGMQSWRLLTERVDGTRLTWSDSARRVCCALLSWLPAGLGWWWALFDRERRTWHDILTGTRTVVLPKRKR
jgi:uncharacterized RDD family membrane protein YckC